jgi:hypothetical protein
MLAKGQNFAAILLVQAFSLTMIRETAALFSVDGVGCREEAAHA